MCSGTIEGERGVGVATKHLAAMKVSLYEYSSSAITEVRDRTPGTFSKEKRES